MLMTKNAGGQACDVMRESHSIQVNNRIHYIADKLEKLTCSLEEQLRPVLVPQVQCDQSKEGMLTTQRPALFNELHNGLDLLDRWVVGLGEIVDRIEL